MTEQAKTESTSLVVIQPTDVRAFFVEGKDVDLILSKIEELATDFVPDVTTDKGRKLIASKARSAASSKVYIDNIGKELNDEEKETPRRIDATRKRVRDYLDALRDRVRQPLTDYENAEKARIAALDQRIAAIQELGAKATTESPSTEIQLWVGELEAIAIDATWDEYQDRAQVAKDAAAVKLDAFLQTRITWEAQQAEIARLKAEQEEKDRIQREEQIAAQARHEAEQKALRDKIAAEQREQAARDAQLKAEADAKEAQQRLIREQQESAERERLAAEQAAERERLAVIQAQEAERQRQIDEQNRIAQEEEQRKAEAAAKAANIEHQKLINNEILDDMQAAAAAKGFQLSREMAVAILSGMVFGKVRHTQVQY